MLQESTFLDERKACYRGCNRTGHARLDNAVDKVTITLRYSEHFENLDVIQALTTGEHKAGVALSRPIVRPLMAVHS